MTQLIYQENFECAGDWIRSGVENFLKYGFVLYPEQKKIYQNLAVRVRGRTVAEAGCGIGIGTSMLSYRNDVVGTDVSGKQIAFAKEMFPMCRFDWWDITISPYPRRDVVVAVEVIEHIKLYENGLDNLLRSAREVYVSTPNRNNPSIGQNGPVNQLHVREFTPKEFVELTKGRVKRILHWETFEELDESTEVTPLVYEICGY